MRLAHLKGRKLLGPNGLSCKNTSRSEKGLAGTGVVISGGWILPVSHQFGISASWQMTTKSLPITIWEKSHAYRLPVGSGRTQYSWNEVLQSRRLDKRTPYKCVTLKVSVILPRDRQRLSNFFWTMTQWKKLILQNNPGHKYVKQKFHKQNLLLVHMICSDIFSMTFHCSTLMPFHEKLLFATQ